MYTQTLVCVMVSNLNIEMSALYAFVMCVSPMFAKKQFIFIKKVKYLKAKKCKWKSRLYCLFGQIHSYEIL